MKKKLIFLAVSAVAIAFGIFSAAPVSAADTGAQELKITRITAPVFADNVNVKFMISFNLNLTDRDLLHINAGESFLSGNKISWYSKELYAQYVNSGVISSVMNNVSLDGKTIQEFWDTETNESQKSVAVMVHLRANTMEITVSGGPAGSPLVNAITGLERNFEITVNTGFLSPLGFAVGTLQHWVFDHVKQAWENLSGGPDSSEYSTEIISINYNGHVITEEGTIELTDVYRLDTGLFYVALEDPYATWKVNKTALVKGLNNVSVEVKSGDKTGKFNFKINVSSKGEDKETVTGCRGAAGAGIAAAIGAAGMALMMSVTRKIKGSGI